MNALQVIQTKKYTNSQKEKANYFLNAFKFKGDMLAKLNKIANKGYYIDDKKIYVIAAFGLKPLLN